MSIKLTLLGTGTFFVTKDRSSSAFLLEADDKKVLMDCGPGTLMRLSQVGVSVEDLDYIFITHFHADHTSDLFPLFMNFRLNDLFSGGNKTKFPKVVGPKGIYEFILKNSQNYQLLCVEGWDKIEFIEVDSIKKLGNIKVEPFKVKHNAFGVDVVVYAYRLEIGSKVIAFSGDSIRCPELEKATKDADILVCDASYSKGKGSPAHMDTYDIGNIARENNVKKVVLIHFYPQNDNIDLAKEVKEKYSGEVIAGKDLMEIAL
ncbi:MAG: MBL fold metallo-hydrolase [Patescibacteria group bacterium]